jgi:hypothetical protein
MSNVSPFNRVPANTDPAFPDKPDFFRATGYEVQAILDAYMGLAQPMADLRGAHRGRNIASLKINAAEVAKVSGQICQMAAHLSYVTEKHSKGEDK